MKITETEILELLGNDDELKMQYAIREAIFLSHKDGHGIDLIAHALKLTKKEVQEMISEHTQMKNHLKLANFFDSILEERNKQRS
jgi:hypothetical protein